MEKRSWMWNRKSSERCPGEDHSNGSVSSLSERGSSDQEGMGESSNGSSLSPEEEEVNESVKTLGEKLSAALVNIAAKEELVKQHAKVAEEAVAGWERAENQVSELKQQLEAAVQGRYDASEKAKQINDPHIQLTLEKENSTLRRELMLRCKDLELMIIERDLSTRAAETASKLQLENIKRLVKLEAECTRLQALARKSDSGKECNLESGDRLKSADHDALKAGKTEANESEVSPKNLVASSVEIDMMDDFLEMERLAGLQESERNTKLPAQESASADNQLTVELDSLTRQVPELEAEKLRLQDALDESINSLKAANSRVAEAEIMLEELQKELAAVNETKGLLEFKLVGMEVEARGMSSKIDSLKGEIDQERKFSSELTAKCQELEKELIRTIQENELEQNKKLNSEVKVKPEDLAIAADKLAECQKTIASLGRQLKSLTTLEDFLIDTSNIPGCSKDQLAVGTRGETWRLTSNDLFLPKCDMDRLTTSMVNYGQQGHGNRDSSLSPTQLASSTSRMATARSLSSFGRIFSPSKNVIELENSQG